MARKGNKFIEAILWIFCIIMFLPLVFVITNSFKDFREVVMNPVSMPKTLDFKNYIDTWVMSRYHKVFINTFVFSGISTLIVLVFTSMAGYKLCRMNTRLSRALILLFVIAMMIPFPVIMIPIASVAAVTGIKNNLIAMCILNAGFSCSMGIMMYSQTVKGIPREIDECALIDGSSGYRLFFRIIFPLLKPVTSTLAVIYIIRYWNDLLLPLILITKKELYTIPLSQLVFFNEYTNNRWNLLLASGVMAVLPVLILYVFTQRYIIQGIVAGAVKG